MKKVLVPLAQGCEELEAITIVDLLRRAGIEVTTAGLDNTTIKASRGSVLVADTTLDQALEQDYDMIALPGGLPGADHLRDDARVIELLQYMAQQDKYIAAICAAPKVLAKAGLLSGKCATAFPGTLEKLGLNDIQIQSAPWVQDGKMITSRGPGTAMDFALRLIEELEGKQCRDNVESTLQRP
ncbi:MAG: DJ-1/PfpI family protein [Gammaproteobacteria bacterium]|nr:DJ-1/PfpI family protein [Gammaproteobacteria bacterium]MDH5800275.1 DJ-1/PfpI family protein [Gammaproteobacteria bacterium]